MPKTIQIAIDGPAGAGKSSVAKALAKRLDIRYLDTGGLFRTYAYGLSRDGILPEQLTTAKAIVDRYDVQLTLAGQEGFFLNGEDVSQAIRENHMSQLASDYSKHPAVREAVLILERQLAKTHAVVMDGRDIGSVVLPEAPFKVFLTADLAERANRRHDELLAKGKTIAYEDIYKDIAQRDHQDQTRAVAPLVRVPDAFYLDTTSLDFEEVIDALLDYLQQKGQELQWTEVVKRVEEARTHES